MSLKAFHVVFVTFSTLLAVAFGVWAVRNHYLHDEPGSLAIGVLSFVGAIGMVLYGRWFLKKLKGVSYL